MKIIAALLLAFLISGTAKAANPSIDLNIDSRSTWTVNYESEKAMRRLVFFRNPNGARTLRWQPENEHYTLSREAGVEFVERLDGKDFHSVSLKLTPTYTHLPADYAPFSPFSDGSTLFHSGRFFACSESCENAENRWRIRINSEQKQAHIVVNGQRHHSTAEWIDSNSGQQVYVGNLEPVKGEHFLMLIDPGLDQGIATLINKSLPPIMDGLAQRLPAPRNISTLYASYGKTSDGRYGHQGGVLPDQVFMHWYGSTKNTDSGSLMSFFAHEAVHIFQGLGMHHQAAEDYWIHEGSAEYMSALILDDLESTDANYLQEKLASARQQCLAALANGDSYLIASGKNPYVHYPCGMLLHAAIHNSLLNRDTEHSYFQLWRSYTTEIAKGRVPSTASFLDIARQLLPPQSNLPAEISSMITARDHDSLQFFSDLGQ